MRVLLAVVFIWLAPLIASAQTWSFQATVPPCGSLQKAYWSGTKLYLTEFAGWAPQVGDQVTFDVPGETLQVSEVTHQAFACRYRLVLNASPSIQPQESTGTVTWGIGACAVATTADSAWKYGTIPQGWYSGGVTAGWAYYRHNDATGEAYGMAGGQWYQWSLHVQAACSSAVVTTAAAVWAAVGSLDLDGDGFDGEAEYLGGTDPLDANDPEQQPCDATDVWGGFAGCDGAEPDSVVWTVGDLSTGQAWLYHTDPGREYDVVLTIESTWDAPNNPVTLYGQLEPLGTGWYARTATFLTSDGYAWTGYTSENAPSNVYRVIISRFDDPLNPQVESIGQVEHEAGHIVFCDVRQVPQCEEPAPEEPSIPLDCEQPVESLKSVFAQYVPNLDELVPAASWEYPTVEFAWSIVGSQYSYAIPLLPRASDFGGAMMGDIREAFRGVLKLVFSYLFVSRWWLVVRQW